MRSFNVYSRFIGGILLIVGTSIGGGMLALPVACAAVGFWQSSLFLLLCWAVMTLGALFILEANLYLPRGKHMVSMASETIGTPGLVLAWISNLFLLFALLSGYISGGADVLGSLLIHGGIHLASWQNSLIFTLIFGAVVYGGIHKVDVLNRGVMFGKLLIYALIIFLVSPHIDVRNFDGGNFRFIAGSIMILITSFGFAIIVPNLREYFDDDIKTLKKVILLGSLIPLFCYLAWNAVIMGSLPTEGNAGTGTPGLATLMTSAHTNSDLAHMIETTIDNSLVSSLFNAFTSICMLSAFLGVALCLISFLADGFNMEQKGRQGLGLFLMTFAPPLLLVIYYPGIYIQALNYAGIFCVILLLLLPAWMVLCGRRKFSVTFKVPGGKFTPWLVIFVSLILLLNSFWHIYTQYS